MKNADMGSRQRSDRPSYARGRRHLNKAALISSLVIVLVSIGAVAAKDTSIVRTETNYYDVYGATADDVQEYMKGDNCVQAEGGYYWATTKWAVSWDFEYKWIFGLCAIKSVRTEVDIIFTYPLWADKHGASEAERSWWNARISDLVEHEAIHARHGRNAARDINRALRFMMPRLSCHRLGFAANARADSIIRKYSRKDKELDRITEHGKLRAGPFFSW